MLDYKRKRGADEGIKDDYGEIVADLLPFITFIVFRTYFLIIGGLFAVLLLIHREAMNQEEFTFEAALESLRSIK